MEKIIKKLDSEMLFVGHLQEKDDLKTYGRDAPLVETEKNKEDLNKVADAIVSKMEKTEKKAVMFITSPRIRAQETARLLAAEIRKRLGNNVKIRYVEDENLKSTEQGKFILPEDYSPGSFFEGLKIASNIFTKESLESSDRNLHYRFGDPVRTSDGSYRYPELAKYFIASGETYAESLVRIFTSVVKMGRKVKKLNLSVEVIIVSHGFTFHILRGLEVLGEQIKQGDIHLNPGDVALKIWEIYKNNTTDFKSLAYVPLDVTNLGDEELLTMLGKEIEYLRI